MELCGKGEGQEQGRSEAGWHMRGVFIAEQVWFGLVWFGRLLLNTVVEQVLMKVLAFPVQEHPPVHHSKEKGPCTSWGPKICHQDGGAVLPCNILSRALNTLLNLLKESSRESLNVI